MITAPQNCLRQFTVFQFVFQNQALYLIYMMRLYGAVWCVNTGPRGWSTAEGIAWYTCPDLTRGFFYTQGEVTGLIFIVTRAFKANKTPLLGKFSWAETVPCYPPIPPRTTCLRHSSDPSSAWLQAPPAAFQRHFNSGAFCLPDYVYLLRFCWLGPLSLLFVFLCRIRLCG